MDSEFGRHLNVGLGRLPVGLALYDSQRVVRWLNPAFCSLTGLSEGKLIGSQDAHSCWAAEGLPALERATN